MSLTDAIPQTIKEIGAAKAAGVRAPGAYGVLLGDVGQMISTIPAQMQQQRSQALREQMASLEVAKAQREAAADKAISGAFSSGAVNPDGSLNTEFITQHLAGTPAASHIPSVLEGITRLQEGTARLTSTKQKVGEDEDDALGAAAYPASLATTPEDQAGLFTSAVAGLSKSGRISTDRAKAAVADLIGEDGNPDPGKVSTALNRYIQGSKTQRTLAESNARTKSLDAERKTQEGLQTANTAKAQAETDARVRANYASQLAGARTPQRYATIYAGIPDKFKGEWDTPEEWNADSTPQHILESVMTPAERETARRDRETAQNRADDLKNRQDELDVNRRRVSVDEARERREAGMAPAARTTAEQKAYTTFSTEYDRARREERERTVPDPNTGEKTFPKYAPVPAFKKWAVMTPQERQAVLSNPNARIDDAEMARRTGSPIPSGVSTPSPTSAAQPAAPAPARTLNAAELAVFARNLGVSIEEAKQKAAAAHIQIVP